MREKKFVEQNKEKWGYFESLSKAKIQSGPGTLGDLYGKITDDLAYARTYYPHRSIRVYLNRLAQKAYLNLYRRRPNRRKTFVGFWLDDLPLALYRSRRELNISLVFFLVAMAIGVFSSVQDGEFARTILGDNYVEMTEANIASGDPMGVYKNMGEFDMFFRITFNNLLVALRTYLLGAFFGVGTLMIMLYNGVMVGTFQYFFIEQDLFRESFLTIWMHGALEISSIVIAGGAGLTLGRGLLFPGTLPRMQSFRLGARRSIKIMLGLAPIFVAAAFIEGFFTRLTDTPDMFRAAFITCSFLFVGLYFWIYPRMRFRHHRPSDFESSALDPEIKAPLQPAQLRSTKEVFVACFALYRKVLPGPLMIALAAAAVYTVAIYMIHGTELLSSSDMGGFSVFGFARFFDFSTFPAAYFLDLGHVAAVVSGSLYFLKKAFAEQLEGRMRFGLPLVLKIAVPTALFLLTLLSGHVLVGALGVVAIPFLVFWIVVSTVENLNLSDAFGRMLKLLSGAKRHIFVTFVILAVVCVLLLFIINAPFTWFYVEVLQWNLHTDAQTRMKIAVLSLVFINQLALGSVVPLVVYGQVFEYFAAREATEAEGLASRVAQVGVKRKAYGLERE